MSKARKIKSVENKYTDNGGPYCIITLGFSIGDNDYILGEFYNGPHSPNGYMEEMNELESDIEHIVESVNQQTPNQ